MIITTNIEVDTVNANLFDPIIIAEDDENSHVLLAQITMNGEVLFILPSERYSVSLHYRRADGTTGSVSGTATSGKVRVVLPDVLFELDDMVVCDIVVIQRVQKTIHSLSISGGEIVVSPVTGVYDAPLRTGLFYIDSQLRVITEYEGGEI